MGSGVFVSETRESFQRLIVLGFDQGRMSDQSYAFKHTPRVATTKKEPSVVGIHHGIVPYVADHTDRVNWTDREEVEDFLSVSLRQNFDLKVFHLFSIRN